MEKKVEWNIYIYIYIYIYSGKKIAIVLKMTWLKNLRYCGKKKSDGGKDIYTVK